MAHPNPTNITGLGEMMVYANTVTGEMFGVALLIMAYVIILIYQITSGEKMANSLISAGWAVAILSIFLYFMSMVNTYVMFVCITLVVLGVIIRYFQDS